MTSIKCSKCHINKLETEFRVAKKETGRRRTDCRDCERKRSKEYMFERLRGMTHADRDKLLEAQGGVCGCCGASSSGSKKGWHVDHCHDTGAVRGILCATCNTGLGMAKDNISRLKLMIAYLEKHAKGAQ